MGNWDWNRLEIGSRKKEIVQGAIERT